MTGRCVSCVRRPLPSVSCVTQYSFVRSFVPTDHFAHLCQLETTAAQARQSQNVDKRHAKPVMWSSTGNTGLVRLPQPKQSLGTSERRAKEHPRFKPNYSTQRTPQPPSARRPPKRLFPATASHARAQAPSPRQRSAGGVPPPRQRQQYTRSTVDGTPLFEPPGFQHRCIALRERHGILSHPKGWLLHARPARFHTAKLAQARKSAPRVHIRPRAAAAASLWIWYASSSPEFCE